MPKNLEISLLLDFYGQMLTEKQRESVEYYYNQDLSLAEIAQHTGITRQGVRDSIKRAEAQLYEYEEQLGLYSRFHRLQDKAQRIIKAAEAIQEENSRFRSSQAIDRLSSQIIETAQQINS